MPVWSRPKRDPARALVALQAELASLGAEPEVRVRVPIAVPKTSAEKVKLFRSLFRGRDEVFSTRFVSKRTGKPGYARGPSGARRYILMRLSRFVARCSVTRSAWSSRRG